MPKNLTKIKHAWERLRNDFVEYDMEPYKAIIREMEELHLETASDGELKSLSRELSDSARKGTALDDLLVKAFALVREAARRTIGLNPFDVQVMAGIAMHRGKLAEMQTGEGKTLAAVLPAYLNALPGRGVHVLTFNDYLAHRDAHWMGPIYTFLGLSVGYIREGMSHEERKQAYMCDITYVTAKEAGFDYLRDFLCTGMEGLVHRPFNYAIIDEADSILIDEARVPLVIAGNVPEDEDNAEVLADIVQRLQPGLDYDTDEYARNVYLTETGLNRVEADLDCGNLYDEENMVLLTRVNNALHAQVLLKRDVDYIVRSGKVELVDEFTGRIAEKRHWPDGLQTAVEAKEGIHSRSRGRIMGSVTIQNFIRQYPKICGMTGTAQTAGEEFKEFYGVNVAVIPTNKPCIRIDHPDLIFTHKQAKHDALISEIVRSHEAGRPVLIGTASVEESERLAEDLKQRGVDCRVLNAKNDDAEARIIADAGMPGAVTVSTNMAGRGTDIKLGGERELYRGRVVALGGLYVIGTNRHESRRIDNQLRGRAGRQGDPGETRFFVSLEDDLMKKFRIEELIPPQYYPEKQDGPIDHGIIKREAARAQRIIEGQNFDIRRTLCKYSFIIEEQRQLVFKRREGILTGIVTLGFLKTAAADRYSSLCSIVGEDVLRKVEKQITLFHINRNWMDYLDYIAYVRESIHLVSLAGKNPLDEFHKMAIEAFDKMLEKIYADIINTFNTAEITQNGIDMEKEGLKGPSSTWTYLISDNVEGLGVIPLLGNAVAAAVNAPLLMILGAYNRFFKRNKRKIR